jgi:DNA-binding protein YbaB
MVNAPTVDISVDKKAGIVTVRGSSNGRCRDVQITEKVIRASWGVLLDMEVANLINREIGNVR